VGVDVLSRGLSTTTALAAKNAKVYIAARSRKRAEDAIKGIKETQRDVKIGVIEMDLADLESVKKGVEEFLRYVPVFFYFVEI
jgi:NAD(P)-dependent dehydrogenase (short-subunit alcohol dehydrogenase family)